jgi:hypothetical protein
MAKPGLYGASCGAVAIAVVGFSWGGWVTGGTARTMAADQSKADVVTALSLICVDQSKRDPQFAERLAAIKAASSWERSGIVSKETGGRRCQAQQKPIVRSPATAPRR